MSMLLNEIIWTLAKCPGTETEGFCKKFLGVDVRFAGMAVTPSFRNGHQTWVFGKPAAHKNEPDEAQTFSGMER
jgi:hypothetical protein